MDPKLHIYLTTTIHYYMYRFPKSLALELAISVNVLPGNNNP
jgi:hypothetical protein